MTTRRSTLLASCSPRRARCTLSAQRVERRTRARSSIARSTTSSPAASTESVAGFDRVVALAPQAAPQLWQRGIALYYAGRYQDCRAQFESHRTVNPNDVENPAWHFLCVAQGRIAGEGARGAAAGRTRPALADARDLPDVPRHDDPEAFWQRAATPSARFFAELYVGLYYDAIGDTARALTHLEAAAPTIAHAGGYMHRVATLHPLLSRNDDAQATPHPWKSAPRQSAARYLICTRLRNGTGTPFMVAGERATGWRRRAPASDTNPRPTPTAA